VYVSGQEPIDSKSEKIIERNIQAQTHQIIKYSGNSHSADRSLEDIVKVTIYVSNMAHYEEINEVYAQMLTAPYPTRSAVEALLQTHRVVVRRFPRPRANRSPNSSTPRV